MYFVFLPENLDGSLGLATGTKNYIVHGCLVGNYYWQYVNFTCSSMRSFGLNQSMRIWFRISCRNFPFQPKILFRVLAHEISSKNMRTFSSPDTIWVHEFARNESSIFSVSITRELTCVIIVTTEIRHVYSINWYNDMYLLALSILAYTGVNWNDAIRNSGLKPVWPKNLTKF